MTEFVLAAPRYFAGQQTCWNSFVFSTIIVYKDGDQSPHSRLLTIHDFIDRELKKYSARWDVNRGVVVFDSKEELTRFKLTHG